MRINNRLPVTLIGEEIAGAWNETALADIAQTFGGSYLDYDGAAPDSLEAEGSPVLDRFDCLIAAENAPGAQSIYSYRPAGAGVQALIVGNEAKGLRRGTRKRAHFTVQIPLPSRNINCLNVAAAASVMLYYFAIEQQLPYKQRSLASIQRSRPDVLLVGGCDHMELGSALRSVCAFGWEKVFLDDRGDAWYDCCRRIKSEGRGTARRGRNPIKVLPYRAESLREYHKTIVFTTQSGGKAPHQLPLTGNDVLIVLQDEKAGHAPWLPPDGHCSEITYAALPQAPSDRYHFRQMSSIALAEVARQLGEPTSEGIYLHGKRDRYRREMKPGETAPALDLDDLSIF